MDEEYQISTGVIMKGFKESVKELIDLFIKDLNERYEKAKIIFQSEIYRIDEIDNCVNFSISRKVDNSDFETEIWYKGYKWAMPNSTFMCEIQLHNHTLKLYFDLLDTISNMLETNYNLRLYGTKVKPTCSNCGYLYVNPMTKDKTIGECPPQCMNDLNKKENYPFVSPNHTCKHWIDYNTFDWSSVVQTNE